MSHLPVPIVVVIIGEGASGGALGIGVGDRVLMFENAWSLRHRSRVMFVHSLAKLGLQGAGSRGLEADSGRSPGAEDHRPDHTGAPGGAHRNHEMSASTLKKILLEELKALTKLKPEKLVEKRIDKFSKMGAWKE